MRATLYVHLRSADRSAGITGAMTWQRDVLLPGLPPVGTYIGGVPTAMCGEAERVYIWTADDLQRVEVWLRDIRPVSAIERAELQQQLEQAGFTKTDEEVELDG
jgi:hypothetical protein